MSLVFTTRRRMAVVVLALLPLVAVAARSSGGENGSSTPTLPSGVSNVSGHWSGTSAWTHGDVRSIGNLTLAIEQHDRAVSGRLTYTSPAHRSWSGEVRGTVAGEAPDTQFVGTIDLRAPASTGTGSCVGTAVVSGRSVADSIRWESSRLRIASNADGEPDAACRRLLQDVVLILGRN